MPPGIRRFEFMLKPTETEADAMKDEFVQKLLKPFVTDPSAVDIIRRRVYTHHSRMAEHFRLRRVFLIGDAAHVMPVWQGQGYNSGIRDSLNLSWKLAAVVRGQANDGLLDTYELERRDHVRAMIQLSTWVGRFVSVRNRPIASMRNGFFRAISLAPSVKSYIVQMRFKPMPTMSSGAITHVGSSSTRTPVGRLFMQPTVSTRTSAAIKLDDAIGPWFALIAWNNDPRAILDADAQRRLARLGVRLIAVRPASQLNWDLSTPDESVTVVGDVDGSLKRWFDDRQESVLLIRPDRIVGGASIAYAASDMIRAFDTAIGAPDPLAARATAGAPAARIRRRQKPTVVPIAEDA
jgi:3-(3-hydroxy-phenyl)propionate hydroxylase